MPGMQKGLQKFFNEIKDLAVTLKTETFEKTFKIKHLGQLVDATRE